MPDQPINILHLIEVVSELRDQVRDLHKATRDLERQIDRMNPGGLRTDMETMEERIGKLEQYKAKAEGSIMVLRLVSVGLWGLAMTLAGWALARTH